MLMEVNIEKPIAKGLKNLKQRRARKMEMCYDGALVMPSSYAVMSEEEMIYVEGMNIIVIKNESLW